MDFNIENVALKGDRILVKQIKTDDKIGTFYLPESVKARKDKRRKDAWKAEVVSLGDNVDHEMLRTVLKKGDMVYCEPVSLDCPAFEGDNDEKFIIVTDEDIIAIEVA